MKRDPEELTWGLGAAALVFTDQQGGCYSPTLTGKVGVAVLGAELSWCGHAVADGLPSCSESLKSADESTSECSFGKREWRVACSTDQDMAWTDGLAQTNVQTGLYRLVYRQACTEGLIQMGLCRWLNRRNCTGGLTQMGCIDSLVHTGCTE